MIYTTILLFSMAWMISELWLVRSCRFWSRRFSDWLWSLIFPQYPVNNLLDSCAVVRQPFFSALSFYIWELAHKFLWFGMSGQLNDNSQLELCFLVKKDTHVSLWNQILLIGEHSLSAQFLNNNSLWATSHMLSLLVFVLWRPRYLRCGECISCILCSVKGQVV